MGRISTLRFREHTVIVDKASGQMRVEREKFRIDHRPAWVPLWDNNEFEVAVLNMYRTRDRKAIESFYECIGFGLMRKDSDVFEFRIIGDNEPIIRFLVDNIALLRGQEGQPGRAKKRYASKIMSYDASMDDYVIYIPQMDQDTSNQFRSEFITGIDGIISEALSRYAKCVRSWQSVSCDVIEAGKSRLLNRNDPISEYINNEIVFHDENSGIKSRLIDVYRDFEQKRTSGPLNPFGIGRFSEQLRNFGIICTSSHPATGFCFDISIKKS